MPAAAGTAASSHVSCVRFAGTERLNVLDRQELTGSLPKLIEGAIAFTQRNIRTAYVVDARPQRREVHEYPPGTALGDRGSTGTSCLLGDGGPPGGA